MHEGRGGVQKGCLLWAGWVRWGQPLSAPWASGMPGFLGELQRSLGAWYPSASFSPGNLRRWGWGEAGNQHRRRGHFACCPPPAHHSGGSHILVLHAPGGLGGSTAGGCPHRGARGRCQHLMLFFRGPVQPGGRRRGGVLGGHQPPRQRCHGHHQPGGPAAGLPGRLGPRPRFALSRR